MVLTLPLPASAERIRWPALPGSSVALAVAEAVRRHEGVVLAVCSGEQQAYRLEEELRFFLAEEHPVVHLPDTEVLPYDHFSPHQEILSARMAALDRLPRMPRGASQPVCCWCIPGMTIWSLRMRAQPSVA